MSHDVSPIQLGDTAANMHIRTAQVLQGSAIPESHLLTTPQGSPGYGTYIPSAAIVTIEGSAMT